MSLDLYIRSRQPVKHRGTGVFIRDNGQTRELKTVEEVKARFPDADTSDINLDGIDWVITGGESGPRARRTPIEWFRGLRDACKYQDVPFFFKQWGAWGADGIKRSKKENGCILDGETFKEYPITK